MGVITIFVRDHCAYCARVQGILNEAMERAKEAAAKRNEKLLFKVRGGLLGVGSLYPVTIASPPSLYPFPAAATAAAAVPPAGESH